MKIYKQATSRWYLERIIFLIAGTLIITSVALGFFWSSNFYFFTIFVGGVMVLFALTGYCPMAIFLHKIGIKEK